MLLPHTSGCNKAKSRVVYERRLTCVEDAVLDGERLHPEVEREDVQVATDAEVLLFVAHVGAAEGRLPQAQVGVALIKLPY